MTTTERTTRARAVYAAYEDDDLDALKALLHPEFRFWSPQDAGLDHDTYLERCWPNHDQLGTFEPIRMVEDGDDVIVTYDATRKDGSKFRNTEILTFSGPSLIKTEVYFGWDL